MGGRRSNLLSGLVLFALAELVPFGVMAASHPQVVRFVSPTFGAPLALVPVQLRPTRSAEAVQPAAGVRTRHSAISGQILDTARGSMPVAIEVAWRLPSSNLAVGSSLRSRAPPDASLL